MSAGSFLAKELPLGLQQWALCKKACPPLKPSNVLATFLAVPKGNWPALHTRAGQSLLRPQGTTLSGPAFHQQTSLLSYPP